jgi:integrase/recombinase XerD
MKEGIRKYLVRLQLKGQSEATRKNVAFHTTAFSKWLMEAYSIEDARFVRKFHLQAFQKYIGLECDYSPAYINQKVMAVNSLFRYLKKEGAAVQNIDILELVKMPRRLPKVITMEQYDQIRSSMSLLDKIGFRNYTIITLFMSSGMRVGGLSRLKVTDVNLEEKTAQVIGKGDKERLVVFGEECKEILSVYLRTIRPLFPQAKINDALFLGRVNNGMTIRSIQKIVKVVSEKSGIESDVTCHTFRRTFCTELIKADGNLYHIAQMMGHESLEHLKCYARLNIKPLKETHERCHPRG